MAFSPKRILLLMDNRGDSNWGSQATTTELIAAFQREYPDAEIRGIRRSQAGRKKWMRVLGRNLAMSGPRTKWRSVTSRLGANLLTNGWRTEIEWADFVVVNGEGTLHPSGQARTWLRVVDFIREATKAPVWIVNCSLHVGEPDTELFDEVLPKVDRIVCRDPLTLDLGAKRGWPIELGADCAFLAEPVSVDVEQLSIQPNGPFAIFTGSAACRAWNLESIQEWVAAIERRGLEVVLTASDHQDFRLFSEVFPGRPYLSHKDLSYRQLIGLMEKSSLHFGGRFHPTIFACKVGVPCIVLESNTSKMEALLGMLGMPEAMLRTTSQAAILERISTIELGVQDDSVRERCRQLSGHALRNVRRS